VKSYRNPYNFEDPLTVPKKPNKILLNPIYNGHISPGKTCPGGLCRPRPFTALALFHRHSSGPCAPCCCGTRGAHRCGLGTATFASEWLGAHGSLEKNWGL
jgi:hypothetical protein